MSHAQHHKPHHPDIDPPEPIDPGSPPVEPDEGPVPAQVPEDPEIDRVVAFGENEAGQDPRSERSGEVTRCP